MKKYIAILVLACTILACGLSPTFTPEQIASMTANAATANAAAWTKVPASPTKAIDLTGHIGVNGAELFSGPGRMYDRSFTYYDTVTIIGQAYNCEWLQIKTNSNPADTGWVNTGNIIYTAKCSDINPGVIPPTPMATPTFTRIPPTKTRVPPVNTIAPPPADNPAPPPADNPAPPPPSSSGCDVNSNILIDNRSDGYATLNLTGPGSFSFSLGMGPNTVLVCAGTYNYTIYGTCGGSAASGYGRISDGDNIYFYCN